MATFTQDTALTFRTGSNVSQPDANVKTRDIFRDALSQSVALLPALAPDGVAAPTVAEIQQMSAAQAKPWVQRLVRGYIRESARAYRVRAAEATHVAPVRGAADETEDAG